MQRKPGFYFISFLLTISLHGFSQKANESLPPINWQLLDWKVDGYPGMSVEKAYEELLANKKPAKKIIVAVIDDGLDSTHPALAGIQWTNPKEIPGNGIDDDHNGYVDDVHGWNFIGSTRQETFEEIREYVRLRPKFEGPDSNSLKSDASYTNWTKMRELKQKKLDELTAIDQGPAKVLEAFATLQQYWSKKLSTDSVYFIRIKKGPLPVDADTTVKTATAFILSFTEQVASVADSETVHSIVAEIDSYKEAARQSLDVARTVIEHADPAWFRRQAIHDDPYSMGNPGYGNGNTFPDDPHGTECAGIIGAQRSNPNSSMGIAGAVQIMPLRINAMGHDCDEWDKDVANAIRYAVDNGAQVVSMSFGKYISPNQDWVTDAIRYARKKGVLLIHAAGNDAIDIDPVRFYPNAFGSATPATNFITVGASTFDSSLIGSFSNYGKQKVDVFAPGVSIYMTKPNAENVRGFGTSYACPMIAGVAALLWSYYPKLTYLQIRACIEGSVTPIDLLVTKPGTDKKVPFHELSKTGGIVNAWRAVQLAQKLASE
jgi:cell wall-associated protease